MQRSLPNILTMENKSFSGIVAAGKLGSNYLEIERPALFLGSVLSNFNSKDHIIIRKYFICNLEQVLSTKLSITHTCIYICDATTHFKVR